MYKNYIEFETTGRLPDNCFATIYVNGKYDYEEESGLILNLKNCPVVETIPVSAIKDIDNASTVEAIPIEWLKRHSWFNVVDLWEKDCKLKSTEEILYDILKEHNFNSYREYVEYAIKIKALPEEDRLAILRGEKENETN